MPRIYIDPHMFSDAWFKEILKELLGCTSVTFSYAASNKITGEISKVRQALAFYKMVGGLKVGSKSRRDDADSQEIEKHQRMLENLRCYSDCSDCDDAHIFALVYLKPTPYIFSKDHRMAKCRDKINKHIDKRYCNFIIISDKNVYGKHRRVIIA